MLKEIINFILHLRLHYQFFILSGGYLMGGVLAGEMDITQYLLQFLNVHILLFGGATAFNSWWDKDIGPVGGLKHPPKMEPWMHKLSLGFMFFGLIWSVAVGIIYTGIYLVSLFLFWIYSSPHWRWKGHPLKSLIAIGVSTGLNSVLLGTLAAGGQITPMVLLGSFGAMLILLSLYPVSQVYQEKDDRQRGDKTFAITYGLKVVKQFFAGNFAAGSFLVVLVSYLINPYYGMLLFVGCTISGILLSKIIAQLKGNDGEYKIVMEMKFLASLSFVLCFLILNAIDHGWF